FQLDYNKTFGDHALSATFGYERSDYDRNYLEMGSNPSNNYLPLMQFDEMNSFNDRWNYEARAGYIGRINYNYKGKYLIEALGRVVSVCAREMLGSVPRRVFGVACI